MSIDIFDNDVLEYLNEVATVFMSDTSVTNISICVVLGLTVISLLLCIVCKMYTKVILLKYSLKKLNYQRTNNILKYQTGHGCCFETKMFRFATRKNTELVPEVYSQPKETCLIEIE